MDYEELKKKAFEEEEAALKRVETRERQEAAEALKKKEDVTILLLRDRLGIVVQRQDLKDGAWVCGNLEFWGYESYVTDYGWNRSLYGSPAWDKDLEDPELLERVFKPVISRIINYWSDVFRLIQDTDSLGSLRLSDWLRPEPPPEEPKPAPIYAYLNEEELNKRAHEGERNFSILGGPFVDLDGQFWVLVRFTDCDGGK